MASSAQNRHIARLLVGAMSIDGSLSKIEQEKVATSLKKLNKEELIAYVGAAIEDDMGDFNMFQECKELVESLGANAKDFTPLIFRMITEVIASDRFVSMQEASYLSAMAKRLQLSPDESKTIFKQVLAERRGRLEAAGSSVDALLHPHLKELLSFQGAEELVGEVRANSMEEMLYEAQQVLKETSNNLSLDDVERALAVLGLSGNATLDEAEEVWKETIDSLNLPKMANLGETFVTAALQRITQIHDAYKTVLHFNQEMEKAAKAQSETERLAKTIERQKGPSTRDNLAGQLEDKLTGVGVKTEPVKEV